MGSSLRLAPSAFGNMATWSMLSFLALCGLAKCTKRTHHFITHRTLLGAKGIATRSKDARGSWPYY